MIEVKSLSKSFGNHKILNSFSYEFPDKGLIGVVGPSGCGKTTLLNLLSGIDQNANGEIIVDGINILQSSKQDILNYRLHKIGYVFQNYQLIPLETGERNVSLPFESSTNNSLTFRRRKIKRLFHVFGIDYLRKQKVSNMSGGERQRITILRAVVNNPKIVLCDEPTGALDEKNSYEIMRILEQISVNSLVIVVSHDEVLLKKFANKIIHLNNGQIDSIIENAIAPTDIPPFESSGRKIKKARIPDEFKCRYSIGKMKSKKIRTLISNIMLSLSLTGIGVSFLLSDLVTNKINNAFKDLSNGNQIVLKQKNEALNSYGEVFGANEYEVLNVANKYKDDILGFGVNYLVNFEDFFKDRNEVHFVSNGTTHLLKNYSVRHINEYKWLIGNETIFPYSKPLTVDDVVLGMSFEDMSNLCYELGIQRSHSALGTYLTQVNAQLSVSIKNNDWEYEDEQIFNVVGITESAQPIIYHSDHLWNEYVFEHSMRFPSFEGGEQYAVWEMLKNYYLVTKETSDILLDKLLFDGEYHDLIFQKINSDFSSILCSPTSTCPENRIYVYYSSLNMVQPSDVAYLKEFFPDLNNFFFTSEFGYSSFASHLVNGFSKNFYLSLEESKLDDVIDADTSLSERNGSSIDLPVGVCGGDFLQNNDASIHFSTLYSLIKGRKPNNNSEIIISTGLARALTQDDVLNQTLHVAAIKNETININNQIEKSYGKAKLKIVGIVEEEKFYLYHSNLWTISFFRDQLEISPFSLIPNGVIFELPENLDSEKYIRNIETLFPNYEASSPQLSLLDSVDDVLEYSKAILLGFSLISLVISFLFLGTMVLIAINESKEEIKLFSYLGIGSDQVRALFRNQTLLRCLLSFLISTIELIAIENIISMVLNNSFNINTFTFSVSLRPLIIVFLCATVVPVVITQLILLMVSKRKRIE